MEIIKIKRNPKTSLLISKLKVAAYVRVSTDAERQLNSFESQKFYYENKINRNENWNLVGIYADEGISGGNINKRNNFIKMIKDAEDGKIDMILTKSISRFARNTMDSLRYVRELKEKGIGVYFEEERIFTLNSTTELLLTVLSSVAQQEIENMSSHLKLGNEMLMREGKLTNGRRCYGYDYDPDTKRVVINKYEAKVVREIFNKFIECKSTMETTLYIRKKKYLNYKKTTNWDRTTVAKILKSKRYIGIIEMRRYINKSVINKKIIKNNGEENKYIVYDFNEKIIDEDTFNKVQEIIKSKARQPSNNCIDRDNEMYCGFCGYSLSIFNRNTKNEVLLCYQNHKNASYYCGDGCSIKSNTVKDILVECVNKYLLSKNTNKSYYEKRAIYNYEREKELLIRQKGLITDLFICSKISKDSFYTQSGILDKKISKINLNIDKYKDLILNNEDRNEIANNFYDSIIDNFDMSKSIYDLLSNLKLILITGGYDEKNHKKPFMIRFVYLKRYSELSLSNKRAFYKKLTINNVDTFKYYVLLDYVSKYKKRMMKEFKDCSRIINKKIRVRLEIVEEK